MQKNTKKTLRDSNAFIFDKEVFEGILEKGADFIVLALGAHLNDQNISINKERKVFKKGSFTVMVAGYKENVMAQNWLNLT